MSIAIHTRDEFLENGYRHNIIASHNKLTISCASLRSALRSAQNNSPNGGREGREEEAHAGRKTGRFPRQISRRVGDPKNKLHKWF